MRVGWGDDFKPMPAWKMIEVPEMEDGYPELLRFGPTPSSGFFLRHLKNFEAAHVEVAAINADPRPTFWLEDVYRADFFAITVQHPDNATQPNFALHNVTDLRIFWSRAAKDTTLAKTIAQTI